MNTNNKQRMGKKFSALSVVKKIYNVLSMHKSLSFMINFCIMKRVKSQSATSKRRHQIIIPFVIVMYLKHSFHRATFIKGLYFVYIPNSSM